MKVLIRADASRALGSGHVMRELALAAALRQRGARVDFACRQLDGHALELVASAGFAVHELALPLDSSEEDDAAATRRSAGAGFDWIVVDHYGLAAHWEQLARAISRRILVVDDLANRAHDGDLLLDQNLYANANERYDGLVPRSCKRLLGPAYALLRPEFAQARRDLSARSGRVRRLHICFGGTDPAHQTVDAIEALRRVGRDGLATDIVIGPGNADGQRIEAASRELRGAACHFAPAVIAPLMAHADLAFGSGGVSTNERLCLGLPAVVTATSRSQERSARDVEAAGGHRFLGNAPELNADAYASALDELLGAPATLRAMSETGMQIVDGQGTERVADHLCAR